jgi:ribosomal protein S25
MILPKDRQEILKWCRYYYNVDPYIYSNIEEAVLSTKIKNIKYKKYKNAIYDILLNILKLGEAFIYVGRNKPILIEPEYININKSLFNEKEKICLMPNKKLKDNIKNKKYKLLIKKVDKKIINKINKLEEIELDNVVHIMNKNNSYDIWGTSVIYNILKILMEQDVFKDNLYKKGEKLNKKSKDIFEKYKNSIVKILKKDIKDCLKNVLPQVEKFISNYAGESIKLENKLV